MRNKYVRGINVFVTGRNLWLSTDYSGVDPETSLTGAGSNVGGFDYFNMPSTKSYILGVNLRKLLTLKILSRYEKNISRRFTDRPASAWQHLLQFCGPDTKFCPTLR